MNLKPLLLLLLQMLGLLACLLFHSFAFLLTYSMPVCLLSFFLSLLLTVWLVASLVGCSFPLFSCSLHLFALSLSFVRSLVRSFVHFPFVSVQSEASKQAGGPTHTHREHKRLSIIQLSWCSRSCNFSLRRSGFPKFHTHTVRYHKLHLFSTLNERNAL